MINLDALVNILLVLIWVGAAVLGVRSTFRVYRTHRAVSPVLRPFARMITQLLVVICAVITIAAIYFGTLAGWRLLGQDPVDWTPVVSIVVAVLVLYLPPYIDRVLNIILRG